MSITQQHTDAVHVAVGVLQAADGRVLIAQRPANTHMAGAWEFPGGKIEAAETPLQGLVRELREELGITVVCARHLTRYHHDYADRRICLYVWKVLVWQGEPVGLENQPLQWLEPADLMTAGLLPADEVIANMLATSAAVNSLRCLSC